MLPGIKYSREKITSKKENGVIKGELAVKDGSCKTADTDKNELDSDVPLGEITQWTTAHRKGMWFYEKNIL